MNAVKLNLPMLIALFVLVTGAFGQQTSINPGVGGGASEFSCVDGNDSGGPFDGNRVWEPSSHSGFMDRWGIVIGGHIQQGATSNSRNPMNPPAGVGNFPATQWNYRNDEYMFNQILLTVGRETDTSHGGWDVGGEIDFVYGTDYIFLQSRGLETHGDLTNHWNSASGAGFGDNGLMGFALPQVYLEVAHHNLTVMLGHFYHPIGYEKRIPTENDYYSTTYGFTFSFEQFQVTGLNADWQLTDRLSLGGGFHRGMQNWEDNNDQLNGFGVLNWTSLDQKGSLSFVFDVGNEDDAGQALRYLQSVILEREFHDRWSYLISSDFGFQQDAVGGGGVAHWYNVAQYLAYQINSEWTAGARFEWFNDIDGFIVDPTPGPGVFYDFTLGLNYTPNDRFILRPEIRWDWFDGQPGVGSGPFGNGSEQSQFMLAMDAIVKF